MFPVDESWSISQCELELSKYAEGLEAATRELDRSSDLEHCMQVAEYIEKNEATTEYIRILIDEKIAALEDSNTN
jgi:hypothetical protein